MTSSSSVVPLRQPDEVEDPLTAVLRSGARRLLAQAIEAEAEMFLATMKDTRLPDGRDRVVRHGLGPERAIQTGIGSIEGRRGEARAPPPPPGGGGRRSLPAGLSAGARGARTPRSGVPVCLPP